MTNDEGFEYFCETVSAPKSKRERHLAELTPLEQDEFLLTEAMMAIQRRAQREMEPFGKALGQLEFAKPPAPVMLPDGRVMTYRGPVAEYRPTPAWLLYHGQQIVQAEAEQQRAELAKLI